MIRVSPEEKNRKLEKVLEHLKRTWSGEEWELLSSFTRVVYASLPDWMALGIETADLAARIGDNYRFFVKELPPPTQLYRGLPGLHVVVRHSIEAESLHTVQGKSIPMDTTIVETHTPDAPFIFDSLKNYFRKAGLRVFSAIHPIVTVKRQWERIVWIGDPYQEGDKELLCRFRIEHVESKDRLRRMQHEIFSMLKCLFLALEDFDDMLAAVEESTRRLRSREEGQDLGRDERFSAMAQPGELHFHGRGELPARTRRRSRPAGRKRHRCLPRPDAPAGGISRGHGEARKPDRSRG